MRMQRGIVFAIGKVVPESRCREEQKGEYQVSRERLCTRSSGIRGDSQHARERNEGVQGEAFAPVAEHLRLLQNSHEAAIAIDVHTGAVRNPGRGAMNADH